MFVEKKLWDKRGEISEDFSIPASAKLTACFGKKINITYKGLNSVKYEHKNSISFPNGDVFIPEFGAVMSSIILDKIPINNKFEFELELPPDSKLEYQPELTADEKTGKNGLGPSFRPEYIVGSYAIFSDGVKIGHITRPFAVDDAGKWIWGEYSWVGKILTKIFPKAWLETAKYPVLIDLTVGYTTKGGTSGSSAQNYLYGFGPHIAASNGSLTSISVYLNNTSGGICNVTLGAYDNIYTGAANICYQLIGDSADSAVANAFDNWKTLSLDAAKDIITRVKTNIAASWDTGAMLLYYDSIAGFNLWYVSRAHVAGTLADPFPSATAVATREYSAYGTYTAAGGGATNMKVNIGGAWKTIVSMLIGIGAAWKTIY